MISIYGRGRDVAAMVAAWCLSCSSLAAHQPHDVVSQVVLSPTFAQDGIVFAIGLEAEVPHRSIVLRSEDRGISWKQLWNGLDPRGDIRSICVSPAFATDSTVFASTDTDGVYASTDGGSSWRNISAGLPTLAMGRTACAIDGYSKLVLLVAGLKTGLVRTDDLGMNWVIIQDSVTITEIEIAPDFASNGLAAAGDNQGTLYYSVDSGSNWKILTNLAAAGEIFDVELTPGGSVAYVATKDGGLYRTTDGAQSFVQLTQCLPGGPVTAVAISPNFALDQTVFTATGNDGIFKSTDGGDCWSQYQAGIDYDDPLLTQYRFFDLQPSSSFAVDQTLFVGMFEGVFRSTDGGVAWLQLETMPRDVILDVAISPDYLTDSTLAICRYGAGASISFDGGVSWNIANTGIENPFFYDVAFSPDYGSDDTLFGLHASRMPLTSHNNGATWFFGDPEYGYFPTVVGISPDFANDRNMFVASRDNGISRSRDGGQSWTQVFMDSNFIINSLVVSPSFATDSTVFAARQVEGVLRSTDGGDSWAVINTGLHLDGDLGPILAVSPNFQADHIVLAGTLEGLYRSTNAGDSWERLTIRAGAVLESIEEVVTSPSFAADGILLTSIRGVGLFKSDDGGNTWTELARHLIDDNEFLQSIRFSPSFATDETLFGFSSSRLFRSTDGGESWDLVDSSPVRHENNRPVHQWNFYEGTWRNATRLQASARRIHWSVNVGDVARFYFLGTGVRWLGARGNFLGVAEVYVDGTLETEVDQYSATLEDQVTLFEKFNLPLGFHEIEITVTDRKHPDATGVGAAVDAFDVIP